jgi:hypothetical protein
MELTMTNKQELFEKAVNGLLAQGVPSYDSSRSCMYRGLNGTKCAIGHLIPDELYDPGFEGTSFMDVGATFTQTRYQKMRTLIQQMGFDKPTTTFLRDLQMRLHDRYVFVTAPSTSLEPELVAPQPYPEWLKEQLPRFCRKHSLENKWA